MVPGYKTVPIQWFTAARGWGPANSPTVDRAAGVKVSQVIDSNVVGKAGLEPATPGLEGRCSIQLSYSPTLFHSS